MSGLDAAITTLLAARGELFQSALRTAAAAAATPVPNATQASVANTADTYGTHVTQSAPGTYGPNPYGNLSAPAPSTQTALSNVARTLDVISRFGDNAALAVISDTPLYPTPPRPASAFAAFTTGLFDTAFSSNAPAVAAARAASQNMPPLPVSQIAAQLAKTVGESGLFYESHLAQWVAGQRTSASLNGEPQARIDPNAFDLPLDFADVPPNSNADARPLPLLTSQIAPELPDLPELQPGGRPVPMPQTPQQAAELAESLRDAPPLALSHATESALGSSSAQATPHASAVQASVAAGIHPASLNIVRQQLDMLARDQFRWQGEAWPGTRFDWEIERQAGERQAVEQRDARSTEGGADEQPWRTRVTLSLPALGLVDAELVLTGDKLVARIRANDVGASRFASDGQAFAQQLNAAGISLASFSVRSMDGRIDFDSHSGGVEKTPKPVPSPLEHLFRASAEEGDAT
jgi:hypothetical protein